MKISKGSEKAQALLERLDEEGDLVDVYSKVFFDRQPSFKDDPSAPFNKEGFEYIVEEYELNSGNDVKPLGHLLFIHVDQYKTELRKSLVDLFKPLSNLIDAGKHDPDFLILNLYTRQMLCVGLGRKNRLFAIDAATGKSINVFGLLRGINAAGILGIDDNELYMARLIEHDVYESVSDLVHALHKLGVAMYGYDGMAANAEVLEHSISLNPDEDGLYQLKDWDDEIVDEEQYTKAELTSMLEEINGYQTAEDQAMKVINIFFPQCERGELNTGDY
jgi:hypothetical protein